MRRIAAIAAAIVICVCASAQDGRSIYSKYSEAQGVSAVYISPAMFRMMKKLPDMNMGGSNVNLSSIVQSLTGMYLVNSGNPEVNKSMKNDVDKFVNNGRYELMMEAKDDGETVSIYTSGKKDIITSFVFFATENDGESTFICLDANMPREKLEELLGAL